MKKPIPSMIPDGAEPQSTKNAKRTPNEKNSKKKSDFAMMFGRKKK